MAFTFQGWFVLRPSWGFPLWASEDESGPVLIPELPIYRGLNVQSRILTKGDF